MAFLKKTKKTVPPIGFVDNSPEAVEARKLQEAADSSHEIKEIKALEKAANNCLEAIQGRALDHAANNDEQALADQQLQKAADKASLPPTAKKHKTVGQKVKGFFKKIWKK